MCRHGFKDCEPRFVCFTCRPVFLRMHKRPAEGQKLLAKITGKATGK